MIAIITVALMAAGMSTLDGILVSLSSIAANDLFLNIGLWTEGGGLEIHHTDAAKSSLWKFGTGQITGTGKQFDIHFHETFRFPVVGFSFSRISGIRP